MMAKILPKESQTHSQRHNSNDHLGSDLGSAFFKGKRPHSSFLFSKLFREEKSRQLLPGREKVS